uniref:Uncharacterized protein n=1 Tax=Neobodo designis TaxID=312471 RepID=A0A7S1LW15_NEODS|mmetsp:Transcript_29149/g.90125  ORF Transcript_29149/g.90125 Transcript_29149/m.90125 type:complete len:305 (+) Transcript_29149:25-939(+)
MNFEFRSFVEYFDAAESFLSKNFREDSRFRVSITSCSGEAHGDGCIFKVSPRFQIGHDGCASSKLKVGCAVDMANCDVNQRVAIDDQGVIKAKVSAETTGDVCPRLAGSATVEINTVAPPTEDTLSVEASAFRDDSYGSINLTKQSGGEGVAVFAAGANAHSGTIGVVHERSLGDTPPRTLAGVGFGTSDFALAGCIESDTSHVHSASVVTMRQERRLLFVSKFDFAPNERTPVRMCIAAEQGVRAHLPFQKKATKFTIGFKADTMGALAGKVETVFCRVRYSFGAKFTSLSSPMFGINIRFES